MISFSYARPFSIAALSTETLSFVIPSARFGWGLGMQSYGFALYRETTATLAGGRKILPHLYAGLSVRGTHLSIRDFGTDQAFCVDSGLLARIGETLHWGISLRNLNGAKIRGESCNQSLSTGIAYHPTEHLASGAGTAPTRFSIGAGFHLGAADISYSAVNHFTLGLSHQASIHWGITERQNTEYRSQESE